MANVRYKDAAEGGALAATDRIPYDKDTGGSSFATRHTTPARILAYVQANLVPSAGSYALVAEDYERAEEVGFIDVDASAGPLAIDLGTPNGFPVEVRCSSDEGIFEVITITYGANELEMSIGGQTAKFVPDGSDWILWTRSF